MGLTNCKLVMTEYVYSQNPLYELRLPISLIVGILVFRMYDRKLKNTLLKVLFPLLITIFTFTLIHYITPMFVDQRNLQNLIQACESWKHKNEPIIIPQDVVRYASQNIPKLKENMENREDNEEEGVDSVGGVQYAIPSNLEPKIEQFSLIGENQPQPQTQAPIVMNLNAPKISTSGWKDSTDYDLASNPLDTYQRPMDVPSMGSPRPSNCLLGSDPCSPLCSGDGQNPCNIVAPVPSVAWQPRTAAAVQNSLQRNQYTANSCI